MRFPVKARLTAIGWAASFALVSACSARTPENGSLTDYLIQDVCVDATDKAIPNDPATCLRKRNLTVGEGLPYILTDYDRPTGQTFQATGSIPVRGMNGKPLVLILKSLEGSFRSDYTFNFRPERDAFDLIDVTSSKYASIIRTFDGGCSDQVFSHDGSRASLADRAGGWILFPLGSAPSAWPRVQSVNHVTYRMPLSDRGEACRDNHAGGLTRWGSPTLTEFESGKSLSAIRSDHFASANLDQTENSLERNYFTREYGLTRWEAWQTLAYCQKTLGVSSSSCRPEDPANPWFGRCTILKEETTGHAGLAIFGGQSWVRVMCRDQTHFIALRTPQKFLNDMIANGSGLTDIDYIGTENGDPPS